MNNILRMIIGFAMIIFGATTMSIVDPSDLISVFFFLVCVIIGIGFFTKGLLMIGKKDDALVSEEEQDE